jgi:hypothetical protein
MDRWFFGRFIGLYLPPTVVSPLFSPKPLSLQHLAYLALLIVPE